MAILIALSSMGFDVGFDFYLQGHLQHPSRPLASELVQAHRLDS